MKATYFWTVQASMPRHQWHDIPQEMSTHTPLRHRREGASHNGNILPTPHHSLSLMSKNRVTIMEYLSGFLGSSCLFYLHYQFASAAGDRYPLTSVRLTQSLGVLRTEMHLSSICRKDTLITQLENFKIFLEYCVSTIVLNGTNFILLNVNMISISMIT